MPLLERLCARQTKRTTTFVITTSVGNSVIPYFSTNFASYYWLSKIRAWPRVDSPKCHLVLDFSQLQPILELHRQSFIKIRGFRLVAVPNVVGKKKRVASNSARPYVKRSTLPNDDSRNFSSDLVVTVRTKLGKRLSAYCTIPAACRGPW